MKLIYHISQEITDPSKIINQLSPVSGFFDLLEYADSDNFAARIDNIHDGVLDFVDRTSIGIAYPWVSTLRNLGRLEYFEQWQYIILQF